MKKFLVITITVFLLSWLPGPADDVRAADGKSKDSTVKKHLPVADAKSNLPTPRAGVRGAIPEDVDKLYWKYDKKRHLLSKDELELFKSAVGEAMIGNRDGALEMFEQFSRSYPKSPLLLDAKKAIESLKAGITQ